MEPFFTANQIWLENGMENVEYNTSAVTISYNFQVYIVLFDNVGTDLAIEIIDLPRQEQFIIPSKTYYAIIGDSYGGTGEIWTFCNSTNNLDNWNTITRTLHITTSKRYYLIRNLNISSVTE